MTDHANDDDARLLKRAAAGDAAAFSVFARAHRQSLVRLAFALAHNDADAQDAVQQALLSAWQHAGQYRGDAPAKHWLFTLVRHAVYRQHRGRAAQTTVVDTEPLEALAARAGFACEQSPEQFASQLQTRGRLRRALATLAMPDREVLVLRDVEGLSNSEAAALLSIGEDAVKSRIHRARLRLAAAVRHDEAHRQEGATHAR